MADEQSKHLMAAGCPENHASLLAPHVDEAMAKRLTALLPGLDWAKLSQLVAKYGKEILTDLLGLAPAAAAAPHAATHAKHSPHTAKKE